MSGASQRESGRKALSAAAMAAIAAFALAAPAQAAATSWKTATTGTFDVATNWTGGVPDSTSPTTFDVAGTYAVNFTAATTPAPASQTIIQDDGNVTFNLNGNTYTVGSVAADKTFFGHTLGQSTSLAISNGTLTTQRSYVGYKGDASITLDGSSSVWKSLDFLEMGDYAKGTVTLTNGATASGATGVVVGYYNGGTGKLVVNNSTWNTPSAVLNVGHDLGSAGTVEITNNGKLFTSTTLMAPSAGSTGTVLVSGTGSSWIAANKVFVGGYTSAGGTATLDIEQGGSFWTQGTSLVVWGAGTLKLANSSVEVGTSGTDTITSTGGKFDVSTLTNTVTGKLTLDSASTVTMHLASNTNYGRLSIAGATNTLTFNGTLAVVLDGGYQPANGDSFDLFDWTNKAGSFTTVSLPGLSPGLSWDSTNLSTTGVISVVPEPAALGLLMIGGLLTLRPRRPAR